MIPAAFDYYRPGTLKEAVGLLAKHGDDAKVLSGGHSLIPAMKFRLAEPAVVVDIGGIPKLREIREVGGKIAIGALVTHYDIESSKLLAKKCPLLTELAPRIGDAQVRNRGTLAGSLAHADPAGDWPAAMLALDAEIHLVGASGKRRVKAADFFVDLMETAIQPGEIVVEIRVPVTAKSVAYVKFAQKASGFAIAGVAVVLDKKKGAARVGVTGVAATAFRATAVEQEMKRQKKLTKKAIAAAAALTMDGVDPMGDIHASEDFRAHLARVHVQRALELAASR